MFNAIHGTPENICFNAYLVGFIVIYRYESQLERFCKFMDPLLDSPSPESLQGNASYTDRLKNKIHNSAFWSSCLKQAVSMGQKDMV